MNFRKFAVFAISFALLLTITACGVSPSASITPPIVSEGEKEPTPSASVSETPISPSAETSPSTTIEPTNTSTLVNAMPKLDSLSEIGKDYDLLMQENPELEYRDFGIPDTIGQCLGMSGSKLLYYFYGMSDFPHLDEMSAEYRSQLKCAGIISTIGEVYPEAVEQMPLEKFLSDSNILDYTYTTEQQSDVGWIHFYCDDYTIWIDTNDRGPRPNDYEGVSTIKLSYPIVIINNKIHRENYDIESKYFDEYAKSFDLAYNSLNNKSITRGDVTLSVIDKSLIGDFYTHFKLTLGRNEVNFKGKCPKESFYRNLDVADLNGDNVSEIIVSFTTGDSYKATEEIHIFDKKTLTEYKIENAIDVINENVEFSENAAFFHLKYKDSTLAITKNRLSTWGYDPLNFQSVEDAFSHYTRIEDVFTYDVGDNLYSSNRIHNIDGKYMGQIEIEYELIGDMFSAKKITLYGDGE